MNWPFIGRTFIYGVLCALWQAGSSVYVLDKMPDQWGWVKIASAALVAGIGGIFLLTRDPNADWQVPPGK